MTRPARPLAPCAMRPAIPTPPPPGIARASHRPPRRGRSWLDSTLRCNEPPAFNAALLTHLVSVGRFSFMPNTHDYAYAVMASGDSQMHAQAALLGEAIEEHVPSHGPELPEPLRPNPSVRNALIPFVALGVTFFVVQRLGGKFLDDVYAQLLQPRIKPLLEKIDARLNRGNRLARKLLSVSIWYAEYQVLVTVALVGSTFDEIAEQMHLVSTVHFNALNWLTTHKVTKPVHYYKIEGGKVNAEPILLDRFTPDLTENGSKP